MSSRRRLCGTANAGSGGDDPVATKPIGSAALGHAPTDRFVETVQPEHQNARSHGRRPTMCLRPNRWWADETRPAPRPVLLLGIRPMSNVLAAQRDTIRRERAAIRRLVHRCTVYRR